MSIGKDDNLPTDPAELLCRAEDRLAALAKEAQPPRPEHETLRLLHELHVHQIELEMQNAELSKARDEVETALARYTDLYDFAPVGYFSLDNNGVISAVNLSGANLLGVERSRLLDRRFDAFVPISDRLFFSDFLWKVFARQEREFLEVTLTTEGKLSIFVLIEAVAFGSGQECRLAIIDITERRDAEDALTVKRHELLALNSSLEARISQAVEELRRKDQLLILQDRLAVMGEMINNIAHQWRQPLNSLGLVIQKLPIFYDSAEFSKEFLEENTVKAMKLINHMSQTIEDFRSFFRSDKVKVTFGVNQVIEHTISLIGKSLKEQQISIDLHVKGDPKIYGYPNEFAQVILNIMMNSRDAFVGSSINDARISVNTFTEKGKTIVTITDEAGGIDCGIMDRLFDPYFTTKEPDKGTGIGLFMSKTIIETNMGGRLTVRNIGSGAEFRIEVDNDEN